MTMYVDKTLFAGYEAYSFVIVGIHNEFIIKNSVRPRIQQRQPISLPTRGETKTALYISWLRSKIINLVGPVKGKRQSFYFVLYLVLGLDCCCVSSGTNKDFTEALFWLRIKLLYVFDRERNLKSKVFYQESVSLLVCTLLYGQIKVL